MKYDVNIYVRDDVHYVQVDEEGLEELRDGLSNDIAPNFIEVYCYNGDCAFAINRKEAVAYTYKEVEE